MGLPLEKQIKYTYSDYLKTPEGAKYQLIEGDLIMVPSPTTPHQRISGKLEFLIRKFVTENNLGEVFDAPCDVYVNDETVVQPDIMFINKERKNIITKQNIKGAPDLVVEILSESTAYLDLVKKKKIYTNFRVKEYWIVDPEEKTVEIHVLPARPSGGKDNKYVLSQSCGEKDIVSTDMFKGLKINLADIFKM